MSIRPGTRLGAFEVQELIGQGSLGQVFRAHHPGLARPAAVKALLALAADPEATVRFQLEAQAVAQLRHPNILQVYDFGELEGTPYLVAEYVSGGSLADRLRHGAAPPQVAVAILASIASALDHAHSIGVVHRDVRPANVLMQDNGSPMLADFGLAKLGQRPAAGGPPGAPDYVSPEQAAGGAVGPASDRYSLAVLAYQLLTGALPFGAETPME